MKRIIILSLVFSIAIFAQNKLTLEESLQIGLDNSRQIKISESVVRSTDAKVSEFTSQMLPKLSLSAGYTYMNLNNPNELGIGLAPIKIVNPFYAYGLQLSIQQPIFTGFQLSSLRSSAKNTYEAVNFEHQRNINKKAFDIHNAFWSFFKAQKQVELTEEYLSSLKNNLKRTKDFLDNGLVTMNDYLKMKVQVSNTELKLIDTRNIRETTRASFNKALGLRLNEQSEVETDLLPDYDQSINYEDLLSDALNSREELRSLQFKIEAGEYRVKATNSNWWPKLYASGSFYLYNLNAKTFSVKDERLQMWFVGLSLNWDLWNWGYTSSKSSQAREEVIQDQEVLELLKEQIELEVYNAYLQLKSEREKINVSKLTVESAEENFRLTKEKYDYQLATSNDLIDSEVELLDAKTKLAFSRADYELAKARLELAVGQKIY